MKDKLANIFFGTVSWAVWAVMIFIIFFSFFLLLTGMNRAPVFSLDSASVSKVEADDELLLQNGKEGENWYVFRLDMGVTSSLFSPFTYTAESFELKAPDDIAGNYDNFTVLDETLEYSKASPDSFTLTLYLNYPEGEEALLERAPELGFGMRGLVGKMGFISKKFKVNLPGFYLSDFSDVWVDFDGSE